MKEPKRQHYLPEFYLDGFCREDGTLWLYDRELKEARSQTPRNTAVKGHYYTFTDSAGEKRFEIEKFLSRIESDAKPVLEKLRARKVLDAVERKVFALFLALLRTRVPEFHLFVGEAHGKMLKSTLRMIARHPGALEDMAAKVPNENGVSVEQLREFIERGEYDVKITRQESLASMLQLTFGLANSLRVCNWLVLEPPTGRSFVTSDNPMVSVFPERKGFYPVGFISPSVAKIIPIAQDTSLVIAGEGGHQVNEKIGADKVRSYNVMVASGTTRFLFARDEALVRSIAQRARLRHPLRRERVIASESEPRPKPPETPVRGQ